MNFYQGATVIASRHVHDFRTQAWTTNNATVKEHFSYRVVKVSCLFFFSDVAYIKIPRKMYKIHIIAVALLGLGYEASSSKILFIPFPQNRYVKVILHHRFRQTVAICLVLHVR